MRKFFARDQGRDSFVARPANRDRAWLRPPPCPRSKRAPSRRGVEEHERANALRARVAINCAMMPPIDWPTMCALGRPSASRPQSRRRPYLRGHSRRRNHRGRRNAARGRRRDCRRSTTRTPFAEKASRKTSRQPIICTLKPSTNRAGVPFVAAGFVVDAGARRIGRKACVTPSSGESSQRGRRRGRDIFDLTGHQPHQLRLAELATS